MGCSGARANSSYTGGGNVAPDGDNDDQEADANVGADECNGDDSVAAEGDGSGRGADATRDADKRMKSVLCFLRPGDVAIARSVCRLWRDNLDGVARRLDSQSMDMCRLSIPTETNVPALMVAEQIGADDAMEMIGDYFRDICQETHDRAAVMTMLQELEDLYADFSLGAVDPPTPIASSATTPGAPSRAPGSDSSEFEDLLRTFQYHCERMTRRPSDE